MFHLLTIKFVITLFKHYDFLLHLSDSVLSLQLAMSFQYILSHLW